MSVVSTGPPKQIWSALRHANFRSLWLGLFASNAGSHMHKVTTAWIIFQSTGSAVWLGADAMASAIPTVALLPMGGVVVDRVDRRKLLMVANLMCAAIVGLLAVLHAVGWLRVWQILLSSALSGVAQAFIVPANSSLLPAVVGEKDVPNAIALTSLQFNLSRVIGPAMAGVALAFGGPTWTFALNAISFLALGATLWTIELRPMERRLQATVRSGLQEAVSFVRRRRDLAKRLLLVVAIAAFGAPVVSLLAPLVASALRREVESYSTLISLFGAGAMAAALFAASATGEKLRAIWIKGAPLGLGMSQIGLAMVTNLPTALLLVFVAGFCLVGGMIQLGTEILQTTPDAMRGRITSFQQMGFRMAQPSGAMLAGLIATTWGIRVAFWSCGILLLVFCGVAVFWMPSGAEEESAETKPVSSPS